MKISQEVRDFAKANPRPLEGGDDSAKLSEGRGSPVEPAPTLQEADAGMAEMSKRFHDEGGELYLPAAE